MKTKLLVLMICLAGAMNFNAMAFFTPLDSERSNYVVIGAFAIEGHAAQFVQQAKKMNFSAVAAINPNRNLFYVYVLHTDDRTVARQEANKIRKATPFSDTWVYTGLLGASTKSLGSDINPVTDQAISNVEVHDGAVVKKEEPIKKDEPIFAAVDPTVSKTDSIPTESVVAIAEPDKKAPVEDVESGSKNFMFKIETLVDKQELTGDVAVFDADKSKKVASYKGNQNIVLRPINQSGNISMVCEVFGYRKVTKALNFNKPEEAEGVTANGIQAVVPFELIRLKKGDFAIMYNVYFFKDAGVMRPDSRYEVSSLLAMMKENPKYKIRIHGHTNGSASGKIVSMGPSKNFFSLADTKEGFGSAKKLSEERANVIREYLMKEGIEESRLIVKAWGGKRPIYDKSGDQASHNVRVEIEILEDK